MNFIIHLYAHFLRMKEENTSMDCLAKNPELFHMHALFNSADKSQLTKLAIFVDFVMQIVFHRNEWENGI